MRAFCKHSIVLLTKNINKMRKNLFIALVAMLAISAAQTLKAAEIIHAATSGKCGDNLTWAFNASDGVLTISGTGPMTNYTVDNYAPWKNFNTQIKELVLMPGMTSIGDYAFYSCSSVSDVIIPYGVTSVGEFAFTLCASLDYVYFPYGVTSIGRSAFAFTILESVSLPHGLKSLGLGALSLCPKLERVYIPSTVTTIGEQVFANDPELKTIFNCATTPQTINTDAFQYIENVGDISLYILDYAEQNYRKANGWSALDIIPNNSGSSSWGEYITLNLDYEKGLLAISGVGELKDLPMYNELRPLLAQVSLSEGITSIGDNSNKNNSRFIGFTSLTSVNIPKGVVKLEEGAFANCISLTSVTIPSSTQIIEDYVFVQCPSLKTIYNFATTPQTITESVFEIEPNRPQLALDKSKCILYVPEGCTDKYQAAAVWRDFDIRETDLHEDIHNTAILPAADGTRKFFHNGQLFIESNGINYNLNGAQVK